MPERKYDLEERLLDYAAGIIQLADRLKRTNAGRHVARQLLKCGTSPLPNHGEAQAAESTNDFIHKLSICLKELRGTLRWLKLIDRAALCRDPTLVPPSISETDELIRIFVASIRTAEQRKGKSRRDPKQKGESL
jgi:four helix bundle protein